MSDVTTLTKRVSDQWVQEYARSPDGMVSDLACDCWDARLQVATLTADLAAAKAECERHKGDWMDLKLKLLEQEDRQRIKHFLEQRGITYADQDCWDMLVKERNEQDVQIAILNAELTRLKAKLADLHSDLDSKRDSLRERGELR